LHAFGVCQLLFNDFCSTRERMTEQEKAMESLAVNMALVLHWLIDTVAPPMPRHVENCYRVMMRKAEQLSMPDEPTP
jgi:hypothetical protein